MRKVYLSIRSQLQIGFIVILVFVALLGFISWSQSKNIAEQAQRLYEHPFAVRSAAGALKVDVLTIHRDMKEVMLAENETRRDEVITEMELNQADAFDQIAILQSQYLGPHSDVDLLEQEFIRWNVIRAETLRLYKEGRESEARARSQYDGVGGRQAEVVIKAADVVISFATNKASELITAAQENVQILNRNLLLVLALVGLIILMTNYFLIRNIQRPLDEMTQATKAFAAGNLQSRSTYDYKNEFGILSNSYNNLAEIIQQDIEQKNAVNKLNGVMLVSDNVNQFIDEMLKTLTEQTHSQIVAVYLLSNDKTRFEHFKSIGLDESGRASFSAEEYEGELGTALSTQRIQHIADIPEDTRFSFYTTSGKFTPREIITLPVFSDNKPVAIFSMATIGAYSKQAIQVLNDVSITLNARMTSLLAYKQIQALAERLELQNRELDAQKNELSAQAVELNQQNSELEMQKKQLSDANRIKTSFISNMSHELRTPLNSIIALSGVLKRRLTRQIPEEEVSYLEVIERNGKNLLELINDILDLSRIEAGREEVDVSPFEVDNLLAEVVSVINPLAKQKNIELVQHPTTGLATVVSDLSKCRHILQNLVGNAVKFTEKGRVEISAQQKGVNIHITVSDTGIGISPSQLSVIFDEFKQVDGSASRKYGGSGLGLAIAKRYAELLGGKITVQSAIGKGSVFTVKLPLRFNSDTLEPIEYERMTAIDASKSIVSESFEGETQKTILVVDDSEPVIIQLKDVLEEQGYTILVARGGEEALDVLQNAKPDAIILDLMMPNVDGFQVLKTVRENVTTVHLPVLILTAREITKAELKVLKQNNVHQLIQKGDINRDELVEAIRSMVNGSGSDNRKSMLANSDKPVVLVVEDNPDNLVAVKAVLADTYMVIEATDGETGVKKAREYLPNLILMDIVLPKLDGISAFKEIRSDTRLQNVPVIALTASVMIEEKETILAYGFDGFIGKPFEPEEINHTIQQVLYGKS